MYIPSSFVEHDRARILAMMRESPFATVIVGGAEPQVAQAPTLVSGIDGDVVIEFHLAVGNPLCQRLLDGSSCLLLYTGPNCYISPSWYSQHPSVPTWNYVSVEARGTVRQLGDADLSAHVAEMSRLHEMRIAGTWQFDDLPVEYQQRMLKGICGFRVAESQMSGKIKLSQNRTPEDRRNVATQLLSSADPLDQRVGRLMMETLDATRSPMPPR